MAAILLIAPAAEPLALTQAKTFLRVEHGDDDELIGVLIAAARLHVEQRTRRALIVQRWRFVRDGWPGDGRLTLPLAPLRSVVAARVYDAAGTAQALDVQAFTPDAAAAPAVVGFVPWALAAPGRAVGGIEIDAEFGYGAAASDVPEPLRHAIRLLLAHWYENRGITGAQPTTALPVGVDALIAPYRALTL